MRHAYVCDKDKTKVELRSPIVLTRTDRDKLLALIRELPVSVCARTAEFLREEVNRADVVTDDVSPTSVVQMGSEVKFIDHGDGRMHRVKLVFPRNARGTRSISILSSVGSALIGLGPGQSIRWTEPDGERSLTVLEVLYDEYNSSSAYEEMSDNGGSEKKQHISSITRVGR